MRVWILCIHIFCCLHLKMFLSIYYILFLSNACLSFGSKLRSFVGRTKLRNSFWENCKSKQNYWWILNQYSGETSGRCLASLYGHKTWLCGTRLKALQNGGMDMSKEGRSVIELPRHPKNTLMQYICTKIWINFQNLP